MSTPALRACVHPLLWEALNGLPLASPLPLAEGRFARVVGSNAAAAQVGVSAGLSVWVARAAADAAGISDGAVLGALADVEACLRGEADAARMRAVAQSVVLALRVDLTRRSSADEFSVRWLVHTAALALSIAHPRSDHPDEAAAIEAVVTCGSYTDLFDVVRRHHRVRPRKHTLAAADAFIDEFERLTSAQRAAPPVGRSPQQPVDR